MTDTIDTVAAARELAARGVPLFPVRSTEGKKVPLVAWKDEATTDPEQIENWWRVFPRAMVGVPMGAATGIFAVDVDTRDGGRDAWATLVAENGLPETRQHTTPGGGEHIFFRHRPGITNSTGRLPPGIDVRGEGGFVVWAGSRNWQGKRYEVTCDAEVADAPPWLVEMIARPPDWHTVLPEWLAAKIAPDAGKGVSTHPYDLPQRTVADPARLRAALAVVPSDSEAVWFRVACALAHELGEAGWPIFHEWSAKSHKYKRTREAGCRRKWEGCRGYTDVTAGTIFHYADEADPGWRQRFEATSPAVEAKVEEPATRPPTGLWLHGDAPPEPTRWLVRNRLPETGVAMLAGQWGTFKTYVWLDIAGCVMTGLGWAGEPVYRPGGVLAFTPEGAASIPMRLAALAEHSLAARIGEPTLFERKPNLARLPFARANDCPMLLENGRANERGLRELIATAKAAGEHFRENFGLPLALVVVDTAMAAANWTSEDSSSEVGVVWNLLRRLSEETGALVLIVDHFGKDQERGTRGSSAKEANADTVIALLGERSDTGEVRDTRAVLRKMRDGPAGLELAFAARIVPMGRDEHDYELTQRVIDWNVRREPKQKKARTSGGRTAMREALFEALDEHGRIEIVAGQETRVVARSRVCERFDALYRAEKPDAGYDGVRSAFRRALGPDIGEANLDGVPYMWAQGDGAI